VPAIYYGDEIGLTAVSDAPPPDRDATPAAQRDFDDAWPDRAPFPWPSDDAAHHPAWDRTTWTLFRDLLRLRRDLPALHAGRQDFLDLPQPAAQEVLALRRRHAEQVVEIYIHRGAADAPPCTLPLPLDAPRDASLLYALGDVALRPGADGALELTLAPLSAAVVARHASATVQTLWRQLASHNRDLVDAAFRQGALSSLTLPLHLYLTVTERCNLRCSHCITDAPQRTQQGRARTMQPWLLDVLEPAFAAADYFAFVHGGESLVAPIFFDLLARIQRARAGRPCDIHLLSNGMLLTSTTVSRLIDHGVTSLSISLDGGRAGSNDRLRIGADFDRILAHIEGALALRAQRSADLRIGVSTVLTSDNSDDLPAFAARLSQLGIDWLKVEEMCPINLISTQLLLDPRSARARATLTAMRHAADPRMLLVDHLQSDFACPCIAADDEAARRFRNADDFANRAHFRGCRADWEQACIDPDGTVHPVDYTQPAIGSLQQDSLLSIWHSAAMQTRRAIAVGRLPVATRTACCRPTRTPPP
jgi:MoaA/NifB/PqqE/SkfB family radical SAM enzyme